DCVDERIELLAMRSVQRRPCTLRVPERDPAGLLQRTGLGDADECAVLRAPREGASNHRVLLRREDEWERRSAVAKVGSGDLPRLDGLTRAVEDVVDDLEHDAEIRTE